MKKDIMSLNLQELTDEIVNAGQPKFRAKQIYQWLHKKFATNFDEMSDLSKELRQYLNDNFVIFHCTIEKKLISMYDNTIKYLFKLNDGEYIESVLMEYKYGYTVCVSSQVGCRMGCKFCASTLNGVVRSLRASEILSQVYTISRDNNIRISHVVMMGMGEPLDNFDNVMKFLELVTDENGVNMSMRHISLSTCGIVPGIYKLMEKKLQLTLSVSLHAPTDEIRSKMMPVNRKWHIDELMRACRDYTEATSRRISFEYALVRGQNDSDECAYTLCRLLKGMLCHVNLIPVNEVDETGMKKSTPAQIKRFSDILASKGFAVTVRRELGADINAACGQLRRSTVKEKNKELGDLT